MIKVKSIARIMVKVEDIEKSIEFAEKVLGAKFFLKPRKDRAKQPSMLCAMSTEPGLELLQVVGDQGDLSMFEKDPNGPKMFRFIHDHPLGVVGVVFDIDGVEESRQAAEELGIDAPFVYDFGEKEMKILGWDYSKYLEYFLEPAKTDNTMILLSEFLKP